MSRCHHSQVCLKRTLCAEMRWFRGVLVRRVLAGATDGSSRQQGHVVVTLALATRALTQEQNRTRIRDNLEVRFVLLVSENYIDRIWAARDPTHHSHRLKERVLCVAENEFLRSKSIRSVDCVGTSLKLAIEPQAHGRDSSKNDRPVLAEAWRFGPHQLAVHPS